MTANLLRWDAEDIVAGTLLSGPDRLVDRVQDAIAEAHAAGIDAGHDESFDEGVDNTLGDMSAALSKELGIEVEATTIDSIIEALKKDRVEQFNHAGGRARHKARRESGGDSLENRRLKRIDRVNTPSIIPTRCATTFFRNTT